ncbi:MAG: hypothetical protein A2Y33_16755 [Spirochaetes bacterium GWF1_51_8]|nr:MAG: hypothetical protein A2Y33_16755 [Spirochaetes bacterium GWF1_51_8]
MKKLILSLLVCAAASGTYTACASAMSPGYGTTPTYITKFFRICNGYSNSSVFAPAFTLWGDIIATNYNAYIESVIVKVDFISYNAIIFQGKLICRITNTLTSGSHHISVFGTDGEVNYLAFEDDFTVDDTLPVSQIDNPFPKVLINSNNYEISGSINPIGGVTTLAIFLNGSFITNIAPAASWNCVISGLPEGISFVSAVIGTGTKNNFMAAALIVADYTKPLVEETIPYDGAVSISLTQDISVTFSEPIQTANLLNLIQLRKIGVPVAANYTYLSNENKVIVDPTLPIEDGVTYTIFISNAVKDTAGNTLISNQSYSFSTLLPPISSNPAFADTQPITIFYPTNATVGLSAFSPRLQWDTDGIKWGVYKYFVLISTAPFQIVGSAVKNKADGVLYWASYLPLGSDGNIDMLRDTYDIIGGTAATSTNYSFVLSQIYYAMVYGVDRDYHTIYSSPILIFRW